jgi:hypothetical protein
VDSAQGESVFCKYKYRPDQAEEAMAPVLQQVKMPGESWV